MIEFFQGLGTEPLLQRAVLMGLLASVACGVVGSYVVIRRITYLAGGISHCVLGGIGAAVYLNRVHGWTWLDPLYGAVAAALLAALVIGFVSLRFRQREDTVISGLWAIGMAAGVLFIWASPGYMTDLMSYLFGRIAIVPMRDVWLIAGLDAAVLVIAILFYKQFLSIAFDEEFARTRGIHVEFYYLLLLCMTALTVVLLVTVVGVVMVIALLALPVAAVGQFTKRLWQMMLAAVVLSMVLTTGGMAISYAPGMPPGATTIVLAGGVYMLALIVKAVIRRMTRQKGTDN